MLALVIPMEHVAAKQMQMVPSVTTVLLVTSISLHAQVSDESFCQWHKMMIIINYFPFQPVPVKHREVLTMLTFVIPMEFVAAKKMQKVPSVTTVLLVTSISPPAQVSIKKGAIQNHSVRLFVLVEKFLG